MDIFARVASQIQKKYIADLTDFKNILELIPQASLLIDIPEKRILLVNSEVIKLTAFTRAELTDHDITKIFPTVKESDLDKFQTTTISIDRVMTVRNKGAIQVQITPTKLDDYGHRVLLTVEPTIEKEQQLLEQQLLSQRLDALYELARSPQYNELNLAIRMGLKASQNLTRSGILAVYHANPEIPELELVASEGSFDDLPNTIPSSDLANLRSPYRWTPGKRVLSTLHKEALAHAFKYLISAPIGTSQGLSGLFIIADQRKPPPEDALSLVQIIAATLTSSLERHSLATHLNQEIALKNANLAVGKTLNEAVQDGVIVVSKDFTIEDVNPSAEHILGYAKSEIEQRPIETILVGVGTLLPALRKALDGIPTYDLGNNTLHRRNGQAFPSHLQTIPVTDNSQPDDSWKKSNNIVIILRDLSEREDLQIRTQQLAQQALLGEVTAVFAHEVRNPINNISTGLQLMARSFDPEDPIQEQIDRLRQDCDRLTHLMNSVLSFAKPIEYSMVSVEIEGLIQSLLERWRPRMTKLTVNWQIQSTPKIPPVHGNPRALDQVFTNLIGNAVEAMSEDGGSLVIKISHAKISDEKGVVEVRISDTGPGIPEEIKERIFSPFFTTRNQGTGLGLAISKRIITAHKGSISVESFPGGTVFQVQLPAEILI